MYFDETQNFTVTTMKNNSEFSLAPLFVVIKQESNNNKIIINTLVQNDLYTLNYTYAVIEKENNIIIPIVIQDGGFSLTKNTDSDWLFQLCTKHPFTMQSLEVILKTINTEVENFNKETK